MSTKFIYKDCCHKVLLLLVSGVNSIGLERNLTCFLREKVTGLILLILLGLGSVSKVDSLIRLPSMNHGKVIGEFPMIFFIEKKICFCHIIEKGTNRYMIDME